MDTQSTTDAVTLDSTDRDLEKVAQRGLVQSRHSHALARLMEGREDLRGVHALADFVDDSLRWTA